MKQKIKITREQIKQAIRRAYPQAVFPDEDRLTVDFVVKTGWEHYPFHFPDVIEIEVDVPGLSPADIAEEMIKHKWTKEGTARSLCSLKKEEPIEETTKRLATESFERCRPHLDEAFAPIRNIGDRITELEKRMEKLEGK